MQESANSLLEYRRAEAIASGHYVRVHIPLICVGVGARLCRRGFDGSSGGIGLRVFPYEVGIILLDQAAYHLQGYDEQDDADA